ncbi:hypothetical protein KDI_26370 [Dictyobacter arantiisoli]|uniref:Uncharacterized protein n=2 Tax=Dictyobacter arantiisoli TaxID=2014874 RepID=A0A5A5TDE9_9CHLR|nr:hypothetical protein KDI_26370 [Dictyobacter arantiisoli]
MPNAQSILPAEASVNQSAPGAPSQPDSTTTTSLPPEAQGEANGGPLGCCLGTMVGLLLSLSVAVLGRFYASPLASVFQSNLSTIIRIFMVIIAMIAVIVCGYFGWKIGKRLYREYDDPRVKKHHPRKR